MEKFAEQLNIEPLDAIEPTEPPRDGPSYGSAAQPGPEPGERVVTWRGSPERFTLDSLYPWSETSKSSAETRQVKNEHRAARFFRSNIMVRDFGYPLEEDIFARTQNNLRERRAEVEARIREERETDQSKGPLPQER
jgi:hypothetical protein